MTTGEALFLDLCASDDPTAHIRALSDSALRDIHAGLIEHDIETGFIGELFATVIAEAAMRFLKQGGRP